MPLRERTQHLDSGNAITKATTTTTTIITTTSAKRIATTAAVKIGQSKSKKL